MNPCNPMTPPSDSLPVKTSSAPLVRRLRDQTGCSMLDASRAIVKFGDDLALAEGWLRYKDAAFFAKDRDAAVMRLAREWAANNPVAL